MYPDRMRELVASVGLEYDHRVRWFSTNALWFMVMNHDDPLCIQLLLAQIKDYLRSDEVQSWALTEEEYHLEEDSYEVPIIASKL